MDPKELTALIQLLDDPDNNVYQVIRGKISQLGSQVIPHLEKAWENSLDSLFQTRIENIIHDIHFMDIRAKLKKWDNEGATNLIQACTILAQFQFHDLRLDDIENKIELIKKDIWLEINENLTALEKIKIVNHIFFDVHKFTRSKTFQNNVQGFFINQVIDTKKGSPIMLAILYAAICQQLNLNVYGVALPKNFILCYKNSQSVIFEAELSDGVLFYINPFNKGVVFGKKEIEQFIKQQKLEDKKAYFQPCTNKDTIINLLNQIIEFYDNNGDKTKADEYRILHKILYF